MRIWKAVTADATSVHARVTDFGLKCFHQKNSDFAVAIKLTAALAFIPVSEVEKAFELVMEEICHVLGKLKADTCILEKTDHLMCYF